MSLSEPPRPKERRQELTPALAVRVGIVGTVVLALFAIVFFRLWFLQVLTGTHYVEAAAKNTTQSVALAPPRGKILSRGNAVLVSSTTELTVQIDPTELPVKVNQSNILRSFKRDDAVYDRLGRLLYRGRHPNRRHPCLVATPPPKCDVAGGHCPKSTTRDLSPIACKVAQQIALSFYANVTVKAPVHANVQDYVDERANEFRGVDVEQTSVSGYPYGDLAAQALGTVGRLTPAEHEQKSLRHVNPNAVVGQSGLEYEYDQYLRGSFGSKKVKVNADGIAVGQGDEVHPTAGDSLKTTLDLGLQRVGQASLQHSIDEHNGLGGAFVAMDPQTGAVYGMGSLPSFNPSIFTQPTIPTRQYNRVFGPQSNDPQFNRATQSQAPDGSTFKVITSTAALESGQWTPDETFDDDGEFCPEPSAPSQCRHNSGGAAYGPVDMETALKVSDDVFYYHLGDLLNINTPLGGPLQTWARRFGVGRNPHIDLPGAADGILPTPAFFDARERAEEQCETATGAYRYTNGHGKISATPKKGYHRSPKHPFDAAAETGGCELGTPGLGWTVGDNINTAVGQGDDEVSPLQLALVYSAIANGGTIVRPHLGEEIETPGGSVVQKLAFPAQRHLHIDPTNLQTIQTGLHEAAQGGGAGSDGTSQTVMQNFGQQVYGKTGTAQYIPTSGPEKGVETDSSWYATYVPASATSKPILVVVWVEGGGFGAVAAAPVARQIMSQWFYGRPGPYIAGLSQDQ